MRVRFHEFFNRNF